MCDVGEGRIRHGEEGQDVCGGSLGRDKHRVVRREWRVPSSVLLEETTRNRKRVGLVKRTCFRVSSRSFILSVVTRETVE